MSKTQTKYNVHLFQQFIAHRLSIITNWNFTAGFNRNSLSTQSYKIGATSQENVPQVLYEQNKYHDMPQHCQAVVVYIQIVC